ncbi:N-acetyltransferase [Heliobacterium undosum]|uniref:N-acetyltransferase n=2 Tax=Heliomicrobium undosum TaxID=121734 RepID=A0A845L419_9FIRM|nr:N-acetyltransferase [Heliomicrobium undosum]
MWKVGVMITAVNVLRTPRIIQTERGNVTIFGPVTAEEVLRYALDEGLSAFRPPKEQQKALAEIAVLPEGQVIVAIHDERIIGYVTFHRPEEFERWAHNQVPGMLELGAIETSKQWRGLHISSHLLEVAFGGGALDAYVIIATEYYWHWDLKGTGLSVWEYQKFLESLFNRVGLRRVGTDEPDILAHPANMLMARVGPLVPQDTVLLFEESLYQNRWMF